MKSVRLTARSNALDYRSTHSMIKKIHVIRTIEEVRNIRSELYCSRKSLGFVPTMGALHEGHIELVKKSKAVSDATIASIFVNPSQFSAGEDLDKYPRTLEKDLLRLENAGIDFVFAPNLAEIYPDGSRQLCHVEPSSFNQILEGKARPEFFRGVATIVCKLFNIIQPSFSFFGQKDISQCILIKQMVKDLNIPVEIQILETQRESDGLAMSSRNVYLSSEERQVAGILFKALSAAKDFCERQQRSIQRADVIAMAEDILSTQKLITRIEYVSVASHATMQELEFVNSADGAVISSAVRLGSVRLIDNVLVGKSEADIIH